MNIIIGTFKDFMRDDCPRKAAALAFYAIFSLPALLLLIVMIAGAVWGDQAAQGQLVSKLESTVGPAAAEQINTMIEHAGDPTSKSGWALLAGIAGLLFAATGALAQIQRSLNDAWNVSEEKGGLRGFVMKRVISLLYIFGIGVLLVAVVTVTTALSAFQDRIADAISIPGAQYIFWALNLVVSLVVLTLVFASIYKYFPDIDIDWKDVWMGAVVTAILFVVGHFLIGLYLGYSDKTSAYGGAGSLALLLLWIYYSALIFLFGAEFTQSWWQHYRHASDEVHEDPERDVDLVYTRS